MGIEIEATFVAPDIAVIRNRFVALKGVLIHDRLLTRRRIYDFPDLRLDKQAAWVRLREDASGLTLTYKQRTAETLTGMVEHEVHVDSFEETSRLLEAVGLTQKAYQESYRGHWRIGECDVLFDEWPWLPAFVEIESNKEPNVMHVTGLLQLDWKNAIFYSVDALYRMHYVVTQTEISTVSPEFHGEIPDLLVEHRLPRGAN